MNCNKCDLLIVNVIKPKPDGEPYKYACKKNCFISLNSKHRFGNSLYHDSKEYYTKRQLEWFVDKKKFTLCKEKYGFSVQNIIVLFISLCALFLSITNSINKKNNFNHQFKNYFERKIDSTINARIIFSKDSLSKDINCSIKDSLIEQNSIKSKI